MPQFLDRWLDWFRAQRTDTRALIIAVTILAAIFSVLLSRALLKIALVVLAVALIGWIVQRGRGGPERSWQIAVGGSLVAVLIFAILAAAASGPTPTGQSEQARDERTHQEKTTRPAEEETTAVIPEVTTPEPAAGDAEPAPEPAEPAPEPPPPAFIPGLTASEAVQSFELNELTCSQEGSRGLLYSCTSAGHPDYLLLYEGEIVGRGPRQIERVEARLSTTGQGGDLQLTAQSYLGGIASDLVSGEAESEEAFNFVYNDEDITGETSTTIGGVEFTLIGTTESKTLQATPAQ